MISTFTRRTGALSLFAFALALLPSFAIRAQAPDASSPDCSKLPTHAEFETCSNTHSETRTIYLHNVSSQNEANEIMVAVRNVTDPSVRIYLAASQNAIVITTYPQEMAKVEAVIHDLDRPRKSYRLTFTLTELDGDKTISTQHISTVAVVRERTSLKQGEKIPIATGVSSSGAATPSASADSVTQFTYLDIGTNFDFTITQQADGVSLDSKIEESSVGTPQTIMGVTEPVIRQTVLQGTSLLTLDKPVMLGSIDVPGSTHRFDIAVVLQTIK
jgi:type II secretory pathway component GspD/PulD (secretin)